MSSGDCLEDTVEFKTPEPVEMTEEEVERIVKARAMRALTCKVVEILNQAVKSDSKAIHELIMHRVPVGQSMIEDPYMICNGTKDSKVNLGMMGVINGILVGLGAPKLMAMWQDGQLETPEGFLGFICP